MLRHSLSWAVAFGFLALVCSAGVANDDPDEVSIECFDAKDKFLRHKNADAFLDPIVSVLDSKDARFKKVKGLADPKGVSFESYNYPGTYLRHKEGRLSVTKCPEEADKKDATFFIVKGLAFDRNGWVSLELLTHPGSFVRNKKGELWTEEKKEEDEAYLKSATFRLVKPVPPQR
jgi:hypothetical protein